MMKLLIILIFALGMMAPLFAQGSGFPPLDWDGDGDVDYVDSPSGFGFQVFDSIGDVSSGVPITDYYCDSIQNSCVVEVYAENGIVRSVFWSTILNQLIFPPPFWYVYGYSEPSEFVGSSITSGFSGSGLSVGDGTFEVTVLAVERFQSMRPTPGSLEDFELSTGVNGPATDFPRIKEANQGDSLVVRFDSPDGGYDFETPLLAAQIFVTGSPPSQPSGFPEVWVNPSPFASFPVSILFDGNDSAFSPGFLPPGGTTLGFTIPLFLSGHSIMLQAFSLAPSSLTGNNFFTASDAHEICVL